MSPCKLHPLSRAVLLALPALGLLCAQAQAQSASSLPTVTVTDSTSPSAPGAASIKRATLVPRLASTSDVASLLSNTAGVSLNAAGGVSSLPAIHGLADDRLRVQVDGMDVIASCPNHMNPALSYLDPSQVELIKVYAGITPVSVGGDSIGGTIQAESAAPVFAQPGQAPITKGEIGAFYRSNSHAQGVNAAATYASDSFNISYSAATAQAKNYRAAGDFKTSLETGRDGHLLPLNEVGSSAYKTRNQILSLAWRNEAHLLELKLGNQSMPYQLYPNQRMDLLKNDQNSVNLRWLGQFDWGNLQARAYQQKVEHLMNFGADKKLLYGDNKNIVGMPMLTSGKTSGVRVQAELKLKSEDLLRAGAEVQHYRLNDWWPPVANSIMMGPNTFININNGQRDRNAVFGEWEKRFNSNLTTLLGLRLEQVSTDAGLVHGYNQSGFPPNAPPPMMTHMMGGMVHTMPGDMMKQARDATAFNTAEHYRSDLNVDLSASAKYRLNANQDIEFGLAHKVRSPNLYERYTWSPWGMMAVMNNLVGDGNGYVGDVNLKPEKANTLSASFDWHDTQGKWGFKLAPFYTRVSDYIDAVQWIGMSNTARTEPWTGEFGALKYRNQSARLYGLDLSGHMPLGATAWGNFGLAGLFNYTRGTNLETGQALYNVMPPNAKLSLTHQFGGWSNSLELVAVQAKHGVYGVRNEIKTPGYSLVNLRASYSWKMLRLDFGVENLFNKFYRLPTGGTYVGQGRTMTMFGSSGGPAYGIAVPGPARSIYVGVNVKF